MSDLTIHPMTVGPLGTCCYLAAAKDGPEAVVVDPGGDAPSLLAELAERGWTPAWILLTHCHYDHIGAAEPLRQAFPEATLACHAECARRAADPALNLSDFLGDPVSLSAPDRLLADGETFEAAGLRIEARLVPGHTPGQLVYRLPDFDVAFTGDTVFAGGIGRSDFPDGNGPQLKRTLRALLEEIPPGTSLFPGHGPATTAGEELANNPFLRG